MESEKALAALYQLGIERHGDITCFEKLQNVVFLAGIFQLDLVHVVVKPQLVGGVVEVELDFVADFSDEVELDILFELEIGGSSLFGRQEGIVDAVVFDAKLEFEVASGSDVDGVAAEYALEDVASDMQLRDQSSTPPAVAAAVGGAVVIPIIVDALL